MWKWICCPIFWPFYFCFWRGEDKILPMTRTDIEINQTIKDQQKKRRNCCLIILLFIIILLLLGNIVVRSSQPPLNSATSTILPILLLLPFKSRKRLAFRSLALLLCNHNNSLAISAPTVQMRPPTSQTFVC